ncbi:putative inorganic phosphate cotransporter [Episyrphus balteatus]|uniref:putative inorganic phosphate cotransporter n=1 Tax=Episyrphus balteatus TaxID=286459 RepID=UPI002486A2D6|nr:putative inorganic phosphate cotransporter [Episyrphus balteatus]
MSSNNERLGENLYLLSKIRVPTPSHTTSGLGYRHFQAFLMFAGMVFSYFLRVNISAAIVPMTQPPKYRATAYYDWDNGTRSLILSSFFWGYVAAQFPSGILAKRYGPKIVLSMSTIFCCIVTVFTPWAAKIGGWQFIIALRILAGLTQGAVYPCMHTLLAKWAPCTERGVLSSVVYSGAQLGSATILLTSGFIIDSSWGWPGVFYISGALCLIWAVAFQLFGADSPEVCKNISKEEKEYIQALTGGQANTQAMTIPWMSMFTSLPFFALIAAHCGFTFGFYTLLTEIPTYLNHVLKMDVKSNAIFSALPYLAMWMLSLIVSPISDALINRKYLSVTASRKMFNTIGQWVPMVCLIALGYMTSENKPIAITLLTIGVGLNSASIVGYMVNHMDLSPNFAGTMMGISNGLSNILSICGPLVVGAVVDDESNPDEWRIVFYITGVVYLICNSLFLIFGSGVIQKWNEPTAEWCSRNTLNSNVSLDNKLPSVPGKPY